MNWMDTLAEPLSTAARLGEWQLIHEAHGGGWLLLPAEPDSSNRWHHLAEDSLELRPISLFDDPRLKGLTPTIAHFLGRGDSVELLAWRVGKRAVLRIRGEDGDRIAKVYRKDRQIFDRWNAFDAESASAWRTPRVLGWHARRRCLTVEFCRGESFNRRWLGGLGVAEDGDRIGELLAWLAARPLPASLPVHGPEEEIPTLQHRLETFERTLRKPPSRARNLVGAVSAALRLTPSTRVLCHRDLHDKQILLHPQGNRLIDLDLASSGPPALDPANILAHAHLRWLKGADLPWEEIAGRIAAAAHRDRGVRETLPVWTASTLLRLALIYSRRRRETGLLESLMDATEAALHARGCWSFLA